MVEIILRLVRDHTSNWGEEAPERWISANFHICRSVLGTIVLCFSKETIQSSGLYGVQKENAWRTDTLFS